MNGNPIETLTFEEFQKVEIRVGTIVEVKDFPEAKKKAFQLKVDLGKDIGIKESSAQITNLYSKDDLLAKQVIVVVNLNPKKIGSFISECLITGFYHSEQEVVLAIPDKKIKNGSRLF